MPPAAGGSTTHLHSHPPPQTPQNHHHHQVLQPIQPQPVSSTTHPTQPTSQGMYSSYSTSRTHGGHNVHNLNGHGLTASVMSSVTNLGVGGPQGIPGHSTLQSTATEQGQSIGMGPPGPGMRHLQSQSHGGGQGAESGSVNESGSQQQQDPPQRSRNARAQARHRAKRKAYIEQLEDSVARLNAVLQLTPEQAAALQLPTAASNTIIPPISHVPSTHPSHLHSNMHPLVTPPSFAAFNPQDGKLGIGVAYTPSSVSGASNGATVNQNQVTLLRLRFVVGEYTTLRNYAMQLYKATEDLGRYRANGMNGKGFWDVIDRVKNLGPVPSPPQSLEHLIGLPELQIHPGSISNTGTVGLVDPAFGSDEVSPSVKRRRKSSELGGEHDIEDGDRREDVSNVYLTPNGTPPLGGDENTMMSIYNGSNGHSVGSLNNNSGHGNRALPPPLVLPQGSSTMRPSSGQSISSPIYNGSSAQSGHSTSLPSATTFGSASPQPQPSYTNQQSPKKNNMGLTQSGDEFPTMTQMPPPMPRAWGGMGSFGVSSSSNGNNGGLGTSMSGLNISAGGGIGGIQLPPPVPYGGGSGAYLARLHQQSPVYARSVNMSSVVPKREEVNDESTNGYGSQQQGHGQGQGDSMHSLSPTSTVDLSPAVGGFSNSTASPIPHHNRSHSQPHNHTHTLQTPPSSHGRHTNSVNGDGNGNGIGAQALASPLSPYSPTGPGNGSHSIHSPYRTPSAQGGYSETGHSHGQSHQGGIPPPSPASYTPQSQQYQNQQNATHQGQSQGVYTGSTSTGISVSNAWSHTPAQTSVVQGYGR